MRAGCVSGCPGCRHTQAPYPISIERKYEDLQNALVPWKERIRPFRFEPDPFDYRRKALLFPNGNLEWGLRKPIPGTYDLEVIPIPDCPVHSPQVRQSVRELERLRPSLHGLPIFAALILEDRVGLVFKSKPFSLPASLREANFKSFWACFHPSAGDRVFDHRGWTEIFGPFDWQDDHGHWVSFGAFTQQRLRLHEESLEIAHGFLSGPGALLDLYSGTGRSLAKSRANEILAIELDSHAIACAKKNAPQVKLLQGKTEHRIPQIRKWLETHPRCSAFINPPRNGVHEDLLRFLNSSKSLSRMAYLSCSSRTLARDLSILSQHWNVHELIPFDFFPWASHYEILALMEKN
jgi:tRNA/tmRNA/rRNA uracil-C5-methylase (TrmA/RlmC/RlmD family)